MYAGQAAGSKAETSGTVGLPVDQKATAPVEDTEGPSGGPLVWPDEGVAASGEADLIY